MGQLMRSHRTIGYACGRTVLDDGQEMILLHIGAFAYAAVEERFTITMDDEDIRSDVGNKMEDAIRRAEFLGMSYVAMLDLFMELVAQAEARAIEGAHAPPANEEIDKTDGLTRTRKLVDILQRRIAREEAESLAKEV